MQEQDWMALLDDEDWNFIKNFILSSGSLKEMAIQYEVSYPTVRLRLDKLIQKITISNTNPEPYVALVKKLALNEKIDFGTAKLLIGEYRRTSLAKPDEQIAFESKPIKRGGSKLGSI